ncbi:MAG: DNA-directed RNA polymerase subunit M [Candidatus Methanomethylicota archaeon]|uniref:DNA-directed RNA polymerase subunit M n=2 Tax=Thermoproteota archaeon TaxID=2056631 RepID=A0A497ERF4_9CREN|nr:MAG: DNA-directed RNA polymerase subunit M [Candidatus Verstraetearchaeota archaeon]
MEFCPKCGKMLVPEKKNEKVYLVCRSCGFKKIAKDMKGYRVTQEVEEEKRRKTIIVEEPRAKRRKEEERELLQEYYEVFLESFAAEEQESGEGYEE